MAARKDQGNMMGEVIRKAWSDEKFKAKLLADTMATLKESGVPVPAGLTVKAVENTDKVFYLVIPTKPGSVQLSDQDLDKVAGGGCGWACGSDAPIQ